MIPHGKNTCTPFSWCRHIHFFTNFPLILTMKIRLVIPFTLVIIEGTVLAIYNFFFFFLWGGLTWVSRGLLKYLPYWFTISLSKTILCLWKDISCMHHSSCCVWDPHSYIWGPRILKRTIFIYRWMITDE